MQDLNLEIGDQEFVSILGPSGCGKSTALRIIGGLMRWDEGDVSIAGRSVVGPRRDARIVFQRANLLPWKTVLGNLMLGVELAREKKAVTESEVEELLDTLGLHGFEESYPHQLSGGMKQRVAVGQALIMKPKVLLLDEPFGALDALTRDKLNIELLRVWQAEKKTVVMVTHSIAESVFLSDRVVVMSERPGRVVKEVAIDLPRPRDPVETRQNPKFGQYVVELGKLMGLA